MQGWKRRRTHVPWAAAAACLIVLLPSCAGGNGKALSADRAFALSASALSGSDDYFISGEVSIVGPGGVITDHSRFEGRVTGHGIPKLRWTEGRMIRSNAGGGERVYHPLRLLEAVQSPDAKASYLPEQAAAKDEDSVILHVAIEPEEAEKQVAEGLRAEMKRIKDELSAMKLNPSDRKEAGRILQNADRELEAVLSTLRADTVCVWTADRKTWFPRTLSEQTELHYVWNGQAHREQRITVTNFLPGRQDGTIVQNAQD